MMHEPEEHLINFLYTTEKIQIKRHVMSGIRITALLVEPDLVKVIVK